VTRIVCARVQSSTSDRSAHVENGGLGARDVYRFFEDWVVISALTMRADGTRWLRGIARAGTSRARNRSLSQIIRSRGIRQRLERDLLTQQKYDRAYAYTTAHGAGARQ
jgi:hypothetical protein